MRSSISAASRMPWLMKREGAASTASCAAIFITLRPKISAASSTSTTATGLKAAPPLSKMPRETWRFSTGPTAAKAPTPSSQPKPWNRSPRRPEHGLMSVEPASAPPPTQAAAPHRILLVTDAWAPQVNGVVRTLEMLGRDLAAMGHEVRYATPEGRFTVPLPTYSEIRLAIFPRKSLERMIDGFSPTAIHIATEGPIGLSARAICIKRHIAFTTSFHTRFPEYVHARFPSSGTL